MFKKETLWITFTVRLFKSGSFLLGTFSFLLLLLFPLCPVPPSLLFLCFDPVRRLFLLNPLSFFRLILFPLHLPLKLLLFKVSFSLLFLLSALFLVCFSSLRFFSLRFSQLPL